VDVHCTVENRVGVCCTRQGILLYSKVQILPDDPFVELVCFEGQGQVEEMPVPMEFKL
jgi:hypothetical protein